MPTYLIQKGTGDRYVFSDLMAKREDMEIVDEPDIGPDKTSPASAKASSKPKPKARSKPKEPKAREPKTVEADVTESVKLHSDEGENTDPGTRVSEASDTTDSSADQALKDAFRE